MWLVIGKAMRRQFWWVCPLCRLQVLRFWPEFGASRLSQFFCNLLLPFGPRILYGPFVSIGSNEARPTADGKRTVYNTDWEDHCCQAQSSACNPPLRRGLPTSTSTTFGRKARYRTRFGTTVWICIRKCIIRHDGTFYLFRYWKAPFGGSLRMEKSVHW